MIEPISNLTNLDQYEPQTAQGLTEAANKSATDAAMGKVNPTESSANSEDDSGSNMEPESHKMSNQSSGAGGIVDLLA